MKIIYAVHQFYPETSGGTEHFLLNVAHAMQRAGHGVEVITHSMAKGLGFEGPGSLLQGRYVYERLPVTAFQHRKPPLGINTEVADPAVASFAREHLAAGKFQMLHLIHPMRVSPFATVADELGIPYVVTLTDFWSICPKITLQTSYGNLCDGPDGGRNCAELCPELPSAWVKSRLSETHRILSGALAVVTPSAFSAAVIHKQFPDLAITVVPHGLNISDFSKNTSRYAQDSPIVFAYGGGLAPHKGVHLLINAFRTVKNDRATLKVFGAAGPNDRNYERELRKSAMGDPRVHFEGGYQAGEVARVLQSVDVLVVPSLWYETYSFSLHEAFCSGVPVVASRIGVLSEKIKEGETGLTFPLGNEQALSGQLRAIADNPTLLNAMKDKLADFEPPLQEEEAYRYDRIYGEALSRGRDNRQSA